MAPTNHPVDQITCSEHFRTTPFPAKMEAKIGDQALCSAIVVVEAKKKKNGGKCSTHDNSTKLSQPQPPEVHSVPGTFYKTS
jgi:hypothetical protein